MAPTKLTRFSLLLTSFLLLLTACNQPKEIKNRTYKADTTKVAHTTPLRSYLSKTDKYLGARSAFYSLSMPDDAFAARLFLIDHATTSLDVQYYIYEDDLIGKVFSAHLLMAAKRGVKVRILLDDISTTGKDHALAILSYHPNIELRLFNPNRFRRTFRNFALLLDINTLGRRMHNKMLVADGVAAIIGGRNIGDVYFTTQTDTLFVDYDVLATGSVVPELYHSFDLYWNSTQSVSSEEVLNVGNVDKNYRQMIGTLEGAIETFKRSKLGKLLHAAPFYRKVNHQKLTLTVAQRTDLYYDHPNKIITHESDTTYHISKQIDKDLEKVDKDIIIISPYFIPSDMMLQEIQSLRKREVKVTIITNSLASTDVFPVYGGYRDTVKALLKMGVELYELKPYSLQKYMEKKRLKKEFKTSLHTKMIIIDNKRLIVGSANLDPRSDKLNTEIVLFISSTKLTTEQREKIESFISLKHLYKLSWEELPKQKIPYQKSYGPVWTTMEDGKEKHYYYPPKAGFLKNFGADLIRLLPVKGYL